MNAHGIYRTIRNLFLSSVLCLTGSFSVICAEEPDAGNTAVSETADPDTSEEPAAAEEQPAEDVAETAEAEPVTPEEVSPEGESEEPENAVTEEPADEGTAENMPEAFPAEEVNPATESEPVSVPSSEDPEEVSEEAEPAADEEVIEEVIETVEETEEPAEPVTASILDRLPLTIEEYRAISDEEANQLVEAWYDYALKKYCYDGLSDVQKAKNITKCVAEEFVYDYRFQSAASMILMGGGDCWGSTNLIIALASRTGLKAYMRNGNNDGGAGSGHRNAIFKIGNTYYQAEAGYGETTKPRPYSFSEEPYALSMYAGYDDNWNRYLGVYQYDGLDPNLSIPSYINGDPVRKIGDPSNNKSVFNRSYSYPVVTLTIPETVDEIASSAFIRASDLETINVAADNPYFKSVNGVLYSKDGTKLIAVPPKTSGYFVVPSTVKELDYFAFASCKNLQEVYIDCMEAPAYNGPGAESLIRDAGNITFIVPKGAKGYDREPWTSLKVKENRMAEGFSLSSHSALVKAKESTDIKVNVKPEGGVFTSITAAASDSGIVSASCTDSTLTLTGKKPGTATVTVEAVTVDYSSGTRKTKIFTETCSVTVYRDVTNLYFSYYPIGVAMGKTVTPRIIVSPYDARSKLKYTSSDPSVASVSKDGVITGVKEGSATVTVKDEYTGVETSAPVNVYYSGHVTPTPTKDPKPTASPYPTGKPGPTARPTPTSSVSPTPTSKPTPTPSASPAPTSKPTPTPTAKPTPTTDPAPSSDPAACRLNGFCTYNGKDYWYENGVRQAMPGDSKNLIDARYHTERGREIFDPETMAWYWLDSVYDGAKAAGKEVWMPYIYQDEAIWKNDAKRMNEAAEKSNTYTEGKEVADMGEQVRKAIQEGTGKWVRYDEYGRMMKGWVWIEPGSELEEMYPTQVNNVYYYDYLTGLMAKGWTTIGGKRYYFDETTGVLQ